MNGFLNAITFYQFVGGPQHATARLLVFGALLVGIVLIRRIWSVTTTDVSLGLTVGMALVIYALYTAAALTTMVSPIEFFRNHFWDGLAPAFIIVYLLVRFNPYKNNSELNLTRRHRALAVVLGAFMFGLLGWVAAFTAQSPQTYTASIHHLSHVQEAVSFTAGAGAVLGFRITMRSQKPLPQPAERDRQLSP